MAKNVRKSSGSKRERMWKGPLILSYGFRPFFLFGPLLAVLAMANWLLILAGSGVAPAGFSARDWHIHEMLFGYSSALIAGFLLTAVPNWTGRLPVQGGPLLILALLWLLGRVAMLAPMVLPWGVLAVLDGAYLLYFTGVIGREIIVARNQKNLKVLLPLLVLTVANIWFHYGASIGDVEGPIRLGFAMILLLIMLIGGRIIPSFTRNWLARQGAGRLPVPFNRLDGVAIGFSAIMLIWWVFLPGSVVLGWGLILGGVMQGIRMVRWAGNRCLNNGLLIILHVFYGFIPFGLLVLGASQIQGDPGLQTAAFHLLGIGAIAGMTAAVSLRATLGHTGRDLVADPMVMAIFGLIFVAALIRALGAVLPGVDWLITLSGLIWISGFGLFVLRAGPMLLGPRVSKGEKG